MKKLMAIILVLVLCAAAGASLAEKTELVVFAAASLTESLTEIKTLYETANPEIELVCNFDSSGTLKTQIQEGAVCDVFISAGQKQVNQLDITRDEEKNPERLDFVLEGSRIDLLENKVALVTPADNPRGIKSFDELTELLKGGEVLMAMGNADVPVGQYTQKILAYYGLDEDALVRILTEPKNALCKQYEALLDMDGVRLTFEEDAVREIARQAITRKCGARGLRAIIEDAMLDTMFELPGLTDINECVITKESLTGGKPKLISGVRRRSAKRAENARRGEDTKEIS